MAFAVFNGLNLPENCRHYKEFALNHERDKMSQELHAAIAAAVNDAADKMDQATTSLNAITQATQEMSSTIRQRNLPPRPVKGP